MKLYNLEANPRSYWETWFDGAQHIVHHGQLGAKGETEIIARSLFSNPETKIEKLIRKRISEGFREIDLEEHAVLLIEYQVEGFGTAEDLEKRHRLEDRMNELLGWAGLGMCDGGSVGSDTMEVCCLVIDFALAQSAIQQDLSGTEFANFTRIYDEAAE